VSRTTWRVLWVMWAVIALGIRPYRQMTSARAAGLESTLPDLVSDGLWAAVFWFVTLFVVFAMGAVVRRYVVGQSGRTGES